MDRLEDSGATLIINKGSAAGVKVGDQLTVRRAGKAITDPATGKLLKRQESLLGTLKITEVDDVSATGAYAGRIGRNDRAHARRLG